MTFEEQYPFQSHYLDIGKHRLHYIDEGPSDPSKPVLVMVHGNPTWTFYWRELIKAFRRDYRVIAVDHLGCGLSDKPTRYSYRLADHIRNFTRLMDALSLERIVLFVHDWGGPIGMGYATEHPEKIEALVVFNTAAFRSKRIPKRIALCRIPGFGKFAIQGLNAFARVATRQATTKHMSSDVKAGYLRPYNSYSSRIAHYRFVQDIPLNSSHPSWETLGAIERGLNKLKHHPMMLLWGEKDWCFDQTFLDTWRERFPDARVTTFADAGHYVVEDAAPQIIPEIQPFLESLPR